jgi:tetratricopeptide (TPR) repeat protein
VVDKTYREPYMNLAEIYNRLGLYTIAESFVLEGLRNSYRHYDWSERAIYWAEKPYDILSVSYYYMDRTDEGIENAVHALQINPFDTRI